MKDTTLSPAAWRDDTHGERGLLTLTGPQGKHRVPAVKGCCLHFARSRNGNSNESVAETSRSRGRTDRGTLGGKKNIQSGSLDVMGRPLPRVCRHPAETTGTYQGGTAFAPRRICRKAPAGLFARAWWRDL